MDTNNISLKLSPATGQDKLLSQEFQEELMLFSAVDGVKSTYFVMDSIEGQGGLCGEFTLIGIATLKYIRDVIIIFLNKRKGRRVSIRIGDTEIKVENSKDIPMLMKQVIKLYKLQNKSSNEKQ